MIVVRAECCDGCGGCVEVCPTGAIYLVDGVVTVDRALCRECEACLTACPREAIVVANEWQPEAEPVCVSALHPEPELVQVRAEPAPLALRSSVWPVVGAALAWAGREIVPRLADYVLYGLDLHITRRRAVGMRTGERDPARGSEVQRGQRRHRWRGENSGR
jgi:NAD-dependent dihydropyrimidine dehydrogenase PreA subunit